MGGTIWFESELGKGSQFHFSIQAGPAEGAIQGRLKPALHSESVDHDLARRQPLNILLAEDNEINRKVALLMLQQMGYMADIATNGVEAVRMVCSGNYDVVLMDMQMPDMDGLEATRRIRLECPAPQPVIIAITANAMAGDREKCLAAQMNDYLSKPIEPKDLERVLTRHRDSAGSIDLSRLAFLRGIQADTVNSLVLTYLSDARLRFAEIRAAINLQDGIGLATSAHKLKGSSANLGVRRIADWSSALEQMGRNQAFEAAPQLIERLESELENVQQTLMKTTLVS